MMPAAEWGDRLAFGLGRLMAFYEKLESWQRDARKAVQIGCKAGCAECCYPVVTVGLPEAVLIVAQVGGAAIVEEKRALIREDAERFLARDPGMRVMARWREHRPCPFLGGAGQCRIYDVRPSACRLHLVLDGERCGLDAPGAYKIDATDLTDDALLGDKDFCEYYGVPFILAPMQVVLLWAETFYSRGAEALNAELRGTPFEHSLTGAHFWTYLETETGEEAPCPTK